MYQRASTKLLAAAAVTIGSAAILATVRNGWVDVADGAVLVAALAGLARTAIGLASDPPDVRRDRR